MYRHLSTTCPVFPDYGAKATDFQRGVKGMKVMRIYKHRGEDMGLTAWLESEMAYDW